MYCTEQYLGNIGVVLASRIVEATTGLKVGTVAGTAADRDRSPGERAPSSPRRQPGPSNSRGGLALRAYGSHVRQLDPNGSCWDCGVVTYLFAGANYF